MQSTVHRPLLSFSPTTVPPFSAKNNALRPLSSAAHRCPCRSCAPHCSPWISRCHWATRSWKDSSRRGARARGTRTVSLGVTGKELIAHGCGSKLEALNPGRLTSLATCPHPIYGGVVLGGHGKCHSPLPPVFLRSNSWRFTPSTVQLADTYN